MDLTSNYNETHIKLRVQEDNLIHLEHEKNNLTSSAAALEVRIKHHTEAKVLLELLKNHKLEKRKDFILKVVNSALVDVFEADYKLDIKPRIQRGKSASGTQKYDIIFYQNGIEIAKNDELTASNGGGVLSIASLFFKILIGYLYSQNKFYIFDESLSQVSPQYRIRLSSFLRKFCDTYGFTLVVVSQTEELDFDAHLVYEVQATPDKDGIPTLEIVNQEGELPESGFFYNSIKNFQSIKQQHFVYSGFTVIRGPNNSGKSASLRAIESILFNNFNVNNYPRLNPGGRNLETEITFGYIPTLEEEEQGKEHKEIGLLYKGKKVQFIINGEAYYGKNLAADKLKEAVEEIGFKYIDVKNLYKNFKGALKEQTERIAYTNQYDGLFLIGSKTTDSEKIFSFLFNTENIALAVAQIKDSLIDMNQKHKQFQEEIILIESKITQTQLEIKKLKILKSYYLIREFQDSNSILDIERNKLFESQRTEKILNKINYLLWHLILSTSIRVYQNSIDKIDHNIKKNQLRQKLIYNYWILNFYINTNINIKIYNKRVQKNSIQRNILLIKLFRNLLKEKRVLRNSFEIFNSKDKILNNINTILNYKILYQLKDTAQNSVRLFESKVYGLQEDIGIQECPHCLGIGIIKK